MFHFQTDENATSGMVQQNAISISSSSSQYNFSYIFEISKLIFVSQFLIHFYFNFHQMQMLRSEAPCNDAQQTQVSFIGLQFNDKFYQFYFYSDENVAASEKTQQRIVLRIDVQPPSSSKFACIRK